jgi:hypothetical protein
MMSKVSTLSERWLCLQKIYSLMKNSNFLRKADKERKLCTKVFCLPGKVLLQGGAGQHVLLLFYDVLHFLLF